MRRRVLYRRSQLCRSAIPAARDEPGVVAEASIAARLASDRAGPLAADDDLIRTGHQCAGRDEGRATTLIGHITQLRQQQRGVPGVVAVRARPPRGQYPGHTIE